MRILVVSFYFPPFPAVGAVRVDSTTRLLLDMGHDVRVLTVNRDGGATPLRMRTPEESVFRSKWRDPHRLGRKVASSQRLGESSPRLAQATKKRLRQAYLSLTQFPDEAAGWILPAIRLGKELCAGWAPDIVYASSPPQVH